ncbi:MAG: DUF885 family protein, partial [Gammaproteobacteria bacterium]
VLGRFTVEDNRLRSDSMSTSRISNYKSACLLLIGLIGQLDSALFRARRLVVDTGLHAKQWTRQQAIDYGIEPSEVERYIVMPGQACSYMIGQLKIVELRERALEALGDDFSIREFHNVVLGVGSVPLAILEGEVAEYIAGVGAR